MIRGVRDHGERTGPVALTATVGVDAPPAIPAVPDVAERVGRLAALLAIDERLLVAARRLHGPWRTRLAWAK